MHKSTIDLTKSAAGLDGFLDKDTDDKTRNKAFIIGKKRNSVLNKLTVDVALLKSKIDMTDTKELEKESERKDQSECTSENPASVQS